jgi:hypothetical protein
MISTPLNPRKYSLHEPQMALSRQSLLAYSVELAWNLMETLRVFCQHTGSKERARWFYAARLGT